MDERRKTVRERTYLGGVIAFNRQASTLNCLVRNFSPRGAKLALEGTGILPDSFNLDIDRKERSYRARLVWRRFNDLGVAFDEARGTPLPPDQMTRLRGHADEKSVLRQLLDDLNAAD
jgi:hypothetical protein